LRHAVRRTPRALVVLLGETRAWELAADAFCKNVLDALGADLAICARAGEPHNPFYERATHLWTFEESGDWAADYRSAVGSDDWRCLLELGDFFMGGIEDAEHPQKAAAAILHFYRSLLGRSLRESGAIDDYDWVIVTRSDFLWPHSHPPVRYLSRRHLYFLDGEQYGGVTDRHAIVPQHYVEQYTSLTDPVFDDPVGLHKRLTRFMEERGLTRLNIESFLAWRLREIGLWNRVRYVPYVPYTVRPKGGATRWSAGVFDDRLGYSVKYPTEKERSDIAARFVSDEASWRRYLAPVRGARRRRRLEQAYRERGLHERAFAPPPIPWRLRVAAAADRSLARLGRHLRKVPGASGVLDARLRRLQAKAEHQRSS
jgi:hypothetical protein